MAEFKLGRIRFVWKGNWSASTTYYKDDIVRSGGNTYVCIAGHTSTTTFANDYDNFWNNLSDGQEWKGDWTVSTYYKVNDIVKYGGYLYIANTGHTSAATIEEGLEGLGTTTPGVRDDIAKWDLYAEGFDYKSAWAANVRYKINDIVKYNSTLYICTEDHSSAQNDTLGLEADQSKWDTFTKGLDWIGEWQTGYRYRVNDIVKYGGQVYVCNEGHTSAATVSDGLELDQSKWDYFHKGIEYKGTYASGVRYKNNDIVKWGGGIWICTQYHTSTATFNESNWEQFVEGLEFDDSWIPGTTYQHGDIVSYGGYIYVAVTSNNVGLKPNENPDNWDLVTTGFNFRGLYGDDSTNQHYNVGDVVTLGGYTYLCIADHETAQRPPNASYWERLNSGLYWKDAWTDATLYDLGDVVRYGDSSYVCISSHTSDEIGAQNGPHQPAGSGGSGDTYWDLVSSGPEVNVLTTDGDLVYYSGVGPARLPIGAAGQVLVVNSAETAPEWRYIGSINNVYYVETNGGVDAPAPDYGITLDQPWKTVRYAAEQVDQGPLRYNAKKLLEANRSFIQAEVVEYVDNTYPALVYTKETCRRDIGQIIDALVWDLSHGGNEKTRAAAISYFDTDGVTYLADNATETADSIDYMIDLINTAVLRNLAPATNYQTANSVPSPITQQILNDYNRGTQDADGAEALVTELAGVISATITAGTTAGVPSLRKPQNSIFVKTGEFAEVLPIIVPENTAVVGDELRSTRIVAAGQYVADSDVPFSLDAISRLQSIVSDVVQNISITKSTSNAESQVTSRPAGAAGAGTAAAGIVQDIYDYIDFKINANGTEPTLAGTNTPETSTDYTYAVEVLEANRTFLVAEITAYIADNQPGNTSYDVAACERDVNRYIDALKYDLIYTGNYKAVLAARYYVNAVTGSKLEDMFYMRNGTGLRNCTVVGLDGRTDGSGNPVSDTAPNIVSGLEYKILAANDTDFTLIGADSNATGTVFIATGAGTGTGSATRTGLTSNDSSYDTLRPLAGAFVSLDPGWGPNDSRAWIINKSPYVQNVTTFGDGCVGAKIDGDLHAGGNDSIVANDFTQLCSDGIGVWCTNLGRTELVSVFSYYGHIGYLAEAGGKIRATNGNSSYGDYGTVAEGVDGTEVPITGNITNRWFDAVIGRVFTDGSRILTLEYLNAGNEYTPGGTTITLNTDGFFTVLGQDIDSPTVKNGGVYTVRLTDPGDTGDFGGDGYKYVDNVAQEGNNTQITLSNTDVSLSSQYLGMAIWLTQGLGAGQYGYISNYNDGTKIAKVLKQSSILDVTATAATTNLITTTDTSSLTVNDQVVFTGSVFGGLTAGTTYYVLTVDTGTTFTVSTSQGGAAVTLSTATGNMLVGKPGWDNVIGDPIEPILDSTTGYQIEPMLRFEAPNPASPNYANTAKARAIVEDEKITSILVWDPGTGYSPRRELDVTTDYTIGATTASSFTITLVNATVASDLANVDAGTRINYKVGATGIGRGDVSSTVDNGGNSITVNLTNITGALPNADPAFDFVTFDPNPPAMTIIDPNNTLEAPFLVRVGDGVLAQPTWLDRGQAIETASATVSGDGFMDRYQPGPKIRVQNMSALPEPGSNLQFDHLPGTYFKLVSVRDANESNGVYSAELQIAPDKTVDESPDHETPFQLRIRYSQVRLTGHDFLDIGTGNFTETNYPGDPSIDPDPEKETFTFGGGRVFYTSTDQDGNFRVGELFSVEQSTGVATLNADAFNLSGLQELTLGEIGLGSTGATISEFSTDGTFTANSDNIVPTQKAIKTYITSQIGGGAATLNVNSITAGQIQVSGQEITTTTGNQIRVLRKMNFEAGVDGVPVAMNYFLTQ